MEKLEKTNVKLLSVLIYAVVLVLTFVLFIWQTGTRDFQLIVIILLAAVLPAFLVGVWVIHFAFKLAKMDFKNK